jgi:transposase-like protein
MPTVREQRTNRRTFVTNEPKTLIEAVRHFSDINTCDALMIDLKWPDGKITCPKCGADKIGRVTSRRLLQCKAPECRKQFSAKLGTIFEDSPLGLDKWFVAIWSVANAKNGISSCELARALGIRQPSAWFMLHRIREAMKTKSGRKFIGEVESDETFVGGKAANMHKRRRERDILGRGAVGKAVVHGLLQRKTAETPSQVKASVVPNTEADTLLPAIAQNVQAGATVYTDAHGSYSGLWFGFVHNFIDHTTAYIRGRVHTNGLENFWSLLKRSVRGTYIRPAAFHLTRYVDEQVFRFNERLGSDWTRFLGTLKGVIGRRLTYRELCAIDGAGFMGLE